MNPNNNFKIPTYAKWVMGIVAAVIGLVLVAYYGIGLLFVVVVAGGIAASCWPLMLLYCVIAAVIGAVISKKRSGAIGPGIWAGIFYALLSLVVGLVGISLHAIATGF